ncbi:hypothetical protein FNL55_20940 [Tardiphaga sp. vice352]|uniref:hypothetical protein n=1 Tax=unclassified Tardiphaga TaxID=2631404 RepID=UPI001162E818|nr:MULTISPECIES: hypothetical protein [unclassified Tardiphaga]QDM18204.1 hypothetical protein FNL53_21450 [Tardiphaga sp. vice278]QDM23211.1 hypothetical protein FIU28_20255 [Tardiphaga sp. vice154]QDM33528.1 hypothetical protein FNL55_20940 [Tardiphaga sp. vice352]
MLWALISSVYVIYLHKKHAGEMKESPVVGEDAVESALMDLEQRIEALHRRLVSTEARENTA